MGARMPESIGDIRNSFDAAYHRLSDKMDAEINQLQEIAGKLKDNIAELRTESLKATSSLRDDTFAAVADVRKNIATIDATVKSYDLIFKVAPVVVAVLGAFGVWKLVQSHLDYEQAISESREVNAHAKVLSEQLGTLVRDDLIDKIESALISEASLDALRSRPEVKTQISSLAKQLQVTNQQLPSDQQTTYYQISNAFTHYMANECVPVLQILDQIREADREHYGYAYMRAACSLRTGDSRSAEEWFGRAAHLTEGGKLIMTLNAQAMAQLYTAKATGNADLMKSSENTFKSLIEQRKDYAPAYINLACAYALEKNYSEVASTLHELHKFETADWIADRIKDDITTSSEQFFSGYLSDYLHITALPLSPTWRYQVVNTIP
jgi:hypothetical protein